jgi:hypothetical protein
MRVCGRREADVAGARRELEIEILPSAAQLFFVANRSS